MILLLLASWLALGGCSATSLTGADAGDGDPMLRISDPSISVAKRVEAVEEATSLARAGVIDAEALRRQLRTLVWGESFPRDLRVAAVRSLLSDPDPEAEEALKELVRLRLPTETSLSVVQELCGTIAERGWVELTPAVVRSFSRPVPDVADADRPEHECLTTLHPGVPVERVVFDVFADPPEEERLPGVPTMSRTRFQAWDLLGRLDSDASFMRDVLAEPEGAPDADPLLSAIRACADDLRAVPRTADELRWVGALRSGDDPRDLEWWRESRDAIATLTGPEAAWLETRHAEPIRWARANRPDWLGASRGELLAQLESRLEGRARHRRSGRREGQPPLRDRLDERADELVWADVLAILVIDEALRNPLVAESIFVQAEMDHADETTEYGGVLSADAEAEFKAMLYPPRPGSRKGDDQFVASRDMIEQSNRSLAHYHLHVQKWANSDYAGPSPGDLAYAARHRRSCVVLTGISEDALAVDYYQPDGVVIDLGELRDVR